MAETASISVSQLASEFRSRHSSGFQVNQGASVLLLNGTGVLFSLVKQKNWIHGAEGATTIKFSGIGGGLEEGESILGCLARELREEADLGLDDLRFGHRGSARLISADGSVNEIAAIEDLTFRLDAPVPAPQFILELFLPLRKDRPSEGRSRSCLQLFVYVARLVSDRRPAIPEGEDIPALLSVRRDRLKELLEGAVTLVNGRGPDGIDVLHNPHFDLPWPPRAHLVPQFTPQVLARLGLGYEDLAEILTPGPDGR